MKRAVVIAVALLFALSIAGFATNAVAAQKKATVLKMSGEVVSLDTAAKMLTVKGKKSDMTFNVGENTKIMMGKHKKLLADLKAGDKVTVSYSQLEGKNMAEKIVMAAKKK